MGNNVGDMGVGSGRPLGPPAGVSFLGALRREWTWWLLGAVASFVLAGVLFGGWPQGLVPKLDCPYLYRGDALSHSWVIQRAIEGWVFDNPRSGYPFGSNFLDYPMSDSGNLLVLKILGSVTGTFYGAYNLFALLSFALTFIVSFCALRVLGLWPSFAASGAFLFSFLPFQSFRIAHLFYLSCFVVPAFYSLGFYYYRNRNTSVLTKSNGGLFIFSLAALFLLSCFGVYYAVFGIALLFTVGIFIAFKTRTLWKMAPVFCGISAVCLGVLLNIAPNLLHQKAEGPNTEVAQRAPAESEVYGLKLIQMCLPRLDHRLPKFASVAKNYTRDYPLVNENHTASLGLIGSTGLLAAVVVLIAALAGWRVATVLSLLVLILSVMFVLGTVGGAGAVFSATVFSAIRSWNRVSIFIGFGAVAVFLLLLQYAVRRGIPQGKQGVAVVLAALSVTLVGLWDQTAPASQTVDTGAQADFNFDRAFYEKLEKLLPAGAAVFQLPYVAFPEVPSFPSGLSTYNLLTGFLHSKKLRWSHGGIKGRRGDHFYRELSKQPLSSQVEMATQLGFSGISVDLRGYDDGGNKIVADLKSLLGSEPLLSREDGQVVFFALPGGCADSQPLAARPEDLAAWATHKFAPLLKRGLEVASDSTLLAFEGWSNAEPTHRWTEGASCKIIFQAGPDAAEAKQIVLKGWSNGAQQLSLSLNGAALFSGRTDGREQMLFIDIPRGTLKAGPNVLDFALPEARLPGNGDPRVLGFALQTLMLQ